jgi:hypothetical protein
MSVRLRASAGFVPVAVASAQALARARRRLTRVAHAVWRLYVIGVLNDLSAALVFEAMFSPFPKALAMPSPRSPVVVAYSPLSP